MRTQRLRSLISLALSLTLVFAMRPTASLAQDPKAQDPTRIPPELEKYRKERVGPLSGSQPDQEETARMQAVLEHKRKHDAMMEFRRTGNNSLTPDEVEAFLDAAGIKRGQRFNNVPVCRPRGPQDVCGVQDTWMVHLEPSVKISEVDTTIETLEAKYGMKKHPTLLVDRELATGAYFVMLGTDIQAAALSRDPLVRLVERDREVVISPTFGKKKTSPTGSPTKASPKAVAPKKVLQSVPYQLDRSDQRDLPLNNQIVRPNSGDEVDIYHIGGHPWTGHIEFAQPLFPTNPSRTINVFTSYEGTLITGCEFAVNTVSQHDTAVLSIAAGNGFGMAPLANIVVYAVIKDLGGNWLYVQHRRYAGQHL